MADGGLNPADATARLSLVGKASPEGLQLRERLNGRAQRPRSPEEPQSSFGAHASALCSEAGSLQ